MNKEVSPRMVGLVVMQDKNGHWSVFRKDKRVSGPLFKKPEIRKKTSKGEVLTVVRHNPLSESPIDFIV